MGVLRGVTSVLRTGTRAVNMVIKGTAKTANSVVKAKAKDTTAKLRLATAVAVFATSVVGLGTAIVKRTGRAVSNSNTKRKAKHSGTSGKSQYRDTKQNKVETNKKPEQKGEEKVAKFGFFGNAFSKVKDKTNDIKEDYFSDKTKDQRLKDAYEREKVRTNRLLQKQAEENNAKLSQGSDYQKKFYKELAERNNNELGYPYKAYKTQKYIIDNLGKYIQEVDYLELDDGTLTIPLIRNYSRLMWKFRQSEDMTEDERERVKESLLSGNQYDISNTTQMGKQQFVFMTKQGLVNELGENYSTMCENPSEILSRVSVDYGKNFVPLFAELLYLQEDYQKIDLYEL